MPSRLRGSTTSARRERRAPYTRQASLAGAIEVGVEDADPLPAGARAPASWRVSVLLPTPPLPEPIATTWRTPASRRAIGLALGDLLGDARAAVADDLW